MAVYPRIISVCSGIGGLDLGLRMALPDARTVCFIEREAFAACVLATRMAEQNEALDQAPIWSDINTFDGTAWRGKVDIIAAGIPCQPFSVAGKQRGVEDERWLWDALLRIIDDTGARTLILENVPGFVKHGLDTVLRDLAARGFDAEWDQVSAADCGAPHRRERFFLLAHARSDGIRVESGRTCSGTGAAGVGGAGESLADADCGRLESERSSGLLNGLGAAHGDYAHRCGAMDDSDGTRLERRSLRSGERADQWAAWPPSPADADGWLQWISEGGPQPAICSETDGLPDEVVRNRAHMLRALGNSCMPAQAALAFQLLSARLLQ